MGAVSDAWERAKDWMSDKAWQPLEDMGLDVPGYKNRNIQEFSIPEEPKNISTGGGAGGGMGVKKPPNPDSAGQFLGDTLSEEEVKRKKIKKKKLGTRALQIPLNITEASATGGLNTTDIGAGLRI